MALVLTNKNTYLQSVFDTSSIQTIVINVTHESVISDPTTDLTYLLDDIFQGTDMCLVQFNSPTVSPDNTRATKSYAFYQATRDPVAKTVVLKKISGGGGTVNPIAPSSTSTQFNSVFTVPAEGEKLLSVTKDEVRSDISADLLREADRLRQGSVAISADPSLLKPMVTAGFQINPNGSSIATNFLYINSRSQLNPNNVITEEYDDKTGVTSTARCYKKLFAGLLGNYASITQKEVYNPSAGFKVEEQVRGSSFSDVSYILSSKLTNPDRDITICYNGSTFYNPTDKKFYPICDIRLIVDPTLNKVYLEIINLANPAELDPNVIGRFELYRVMVNLYLKADPSPALHAHLVKSGFSI